MNVRLRNILRTIIHQLPNEFDSHKVIERLNAEYSEFYAELKEGYAGGERTANSVIARALAYNSRRFDIIKTGEMQNSINIKGNVTPNHCWRKGTAL